MNRITLIIILLFSWATTAMATHNRAGKITYEWISGSTYKATITTCTKTSSPADRPELVISWGDGEIDTLARSSVVLMTPYDAQENIYEGEHTYTGSATFNITVLDPNRNGGIENIFQSVNQPFCLQSQLVISPFFGSQGNNSAILQDCPCPEFACINKKYCYNVAATDPDGDSLSFELVAPLGSLCDPMPIPQMYVYPDAAPTGSPPGGGGGVLTIDPFTGTLCWDAPGVQGEFSIAILIKEFRGGVMIGSVLMDMQLTVEGLCNNDPPELTEISDTCIVAGSTLQFDISATDINNDIITINGFGAPFLETVSPATFQQTTTNAGFSEGTFNWQTTCDHISSSQYPVYFVADDDDPDVPLSDIKTMFITVVAPPPTGLSVTPQGSTMNLSWSPSSCPNAEGYVIYRKIDTTAADTNTCCQQDTPELLGYTQVGTTSDINDTTFTDIGPLTLGETYCYVVAALFDGNVISCISEEACSELIKDVPVITHVSITSTDGTTGTDTVMWSQPTELDTVAIAPPPYLYKVYRETGFVSTISTLVHTTNAANSLYLNDTVFVDNGLNTVATPYTYRVELFNITNSGADTNLLGTTNTASSIYLSLSPTDNEMILTWQEVVPWINASYEIYRAPTFNGTYALIGTSTTQTYTDTGLVNGVEYCYKVRSIGSYTSPSIVNPILNWSQQVCDRPIDLTPPCPPVLTIDADCELEENSLWWTNPNNYCADDVVEYNLYYTPIEGDPMTLIATFNSEFDTTFLHNNDGSIAGCYAVTAIDSVNTLGFQNESDMSNVVCIDNCPIYWLPNVFTPNGDGENDIFGPLQPYKFIDSIELEIYNRWGQIVFKTTDPDINWDGIVMESGEAATDGVYYYVCKVYSIRLTGIEVTELKDFFHLFNGTNTPNN
jgi:gliding motility-associated-like protein